MNELVEVAVIGTREASEEHLETWSYIPNVNIVEVIGVATDDKQQLPKLDYRVADLKSVRIDIVDLCVPLRDRADYVRRVSNEGNPIICEAPLALNVEEALSVIKECQEKNVQLHC